MNKCELYDRCPIFKTLDGMAALKIYLHDYCEENSERCARLRVYRAAGGAAVPLALLPDQADEADQIIAQVRAGRLRALR